MAQNTKHVGALANTGTRCIVMFREVPNEPENCLVIETDSLPDWAHDDIIKMVDGPKAQEAANLWEVADRTVFSNGESMLAFSHKAGWLKKVATDNVEMKPNSFTSIKLDELNNLIREQSGEPNNAVPEFKAETTADALGQMDAQRRVTTENVEELANPTPPMAPNTDGVIDDTAMASNMMAQAESFESEAKALREQAYELNPDLKPKRGRPPKAKK